ncbi:RGS1-HXK1-interacting protein 1-like [Aristolochia californica]|uniref:RGS1-HXK1-interacting protein 1-like n=1 Tax=Aristolochia californica TaxID=171875 RepID=UPI0035DC98CD
MGESSNSSSSSSSESAVPAGERLWHTYSAENLKSTARSLQQNSAIQFHNLQHLIPQLKTHYKTFEDGFVNKVKDELMSAREHPTLACGMAVTVGLLLMRGPRRFLFRHTLGRLQSEEAKYNKTENRIREYGMSVALVKKDGQKLRERALFAEEEMRKGCTKLKNAGDEIQMLLKTIQKFERQAADLMEGLREIPGREAIKLRAEVASMASAAKQQKNALNKRILKIAELGVPV